MNEQEQQCVIQAVAWINVGYRREECIRFLVSEGYSESFATDIVDRAFRLITQDEQ